MTITKGNVFYKDKNDTLTEVGGKVTCSCGGRQQLSKVVETSKHYVNTYRCECGNIITVELRRSRKRDS